MPNMSFMFQGLGGKSPSEYALEGLESQERGIRLQDLYQKRQDDESLRRAIVTDPTSGKIDRQSTLRNLANKPHLQAQLGQEFARQDAEEQKAQSVIGLQQAQSQKAIQEAVSKMNDDQREQMIAQAKDIAAASAWVRKQPNPAAAWDAAVESFGAPQEKGKYSPERLDMYEMTAKALMSGKPESFKGQSDVGKLSMDYRAGLMSEQDYRSAVKKATTPSAAVNVQLGGVEKGIDAEGNPVFFQPNKKGGAAVVIPNVRPGETGKAKPNPEKLKAIIGEAESLLTQAPGSYLGAGMSLAKRAVGYSDVSTRAQSQLQALQAALMMNMPRMEGPQSDRDVALYREQAGRIGDPTVPAGDKLAALKMIKQINMKYSSAQDPKQKEKQPQNQGASSSDDLMNQLFGGK